MSDHAPSLRIPQHTRQRRVDALDGRRPPERQLVVDELDDQIGTQTGDAHVAEPFDDVPCPAPVGREAVHPGSRVAFLAAQPFLDGLAHRLSRDGLEVAQGTFRGAPVVSEGDVPVTATDAAADVPLAGTGVPSGFRVLAGLREGGHMAVDRLGGAENPIPMRVPEATSKELVPSETRRMQDVPAFGAAVGGGNAWHVAEWDDVLWWVTDRLEQADPQLWQVAP